jgi:uncharacterized protein YndB with AHSA1/START domain
MTQLQATIDGVTSPIRREILWLVWHEELAVGDISSAFELAAPTISGHLAALRSAGLVTMRAEGNFRRYRADRAAMAALLPLLGREDSRWRDVRVFDEQRLATAESTSLVRVGVELETDPSTAFAAFTDADKFARWLGVPVRLEDNRFSCTLEWGTRVRGHYEVVVPRELIALRWDFDDDNVPLPGQQLVAYLRFASTAAGCAVEVHQIADGDAQVTFLTAAWSMVLGRLRRWFGPDAD